VLEQLICAKMPHPYQTKEEILKLGIIDPELDEASEPYAPRIQRPY